MTRIWLLVVGLGLITLEPGCARFRQNLRGQELSYRGAWHCPQGACAERGMERSRKGRREGTVDVATVNLEPRVALVFSAASDQPIGTLEATVEDCAGNHMAVSDQDIKHPTSHTLAEASDAWLVILRSDHLTDLQQPPECNLWRVTAKAAWGDETTHQMSAAVELQD